MWSNAKWRLIGHHANDHRVRTDLRVCALVMFIVSVQLVLLFLPPPESEAKLKSCSLVKHFLFKLSLFLGGWGLTRALFLIRHALKPSLTCLSSPDILIRDRGAAEKKK